MRFLWPRARGWVLVLGSVLLGVGCGAGIGYLSSNRAAGAATGVVITVAGTLGVRGVALLSARSDKRAAVPGSVLSGRLIRVRNLPDPIVLGVHPAAVESLGRVPPYVRER